MKVVHEIVTASEVGEHGTCVLLTFIDLRFIPQYWYEFNCN